MSVSSLASYESLTLDPIPHPPTDTEADLHTREPDSPGPEHPPIFPTSHSPSRLGTAQTPQFLFSSPAFHPTPSGSTIAPWDIPSISNLIHPTPAIPFFATVQRAYYTHITYLANSGSQKRLHNMQMWWDIFSSPSHTPYSDGVDLVLDTIAVVSGPDGPLEYWPLVLRAEVMYLLLGGGEGEESGWGGMYDDSVCTEVGERTKMWVKGVQEAHVAAPVKTRRLKRGREETEDGYEPEGWSEKRWCGSERSVVRGRVRVVGVEMPRGVWDCVGTAVKAVGRAVRGLLGGFV